MTDRKRRQIEVARQYSTAMELFDLIIKNAITSIGQENALIITSIIKYLKGLNLNRFHLKVINRVHMLLLQQIITNYLHFYLEFSD